MSQDQGASAKADRAATLSEPSQSSVVSGTAGIPCAFTPGPWRALPCVKREGHTIYDEIGIVVANTGTHSAGSDEPGNARLIAAAPELYEALVEIAKGAGPFNRDPLIHAENTIESMKEIAEAALAKARGGQ